MRLTFEDEIFDCDLKEDRDKFVSLKNLSEILMKKNQNILILNMVATTELH